MCLAGPFFMRTPPRNRIILVMKVSGPTKSTCCVTLTTCFEAGIGAPLEIPEELQRPTKHLTLVNVSTLDNFNVCAQDALPPSLSPAYSAWNLRRSIG